MAAGIRAEVTRRPWLVLFGLLILGLSAGGYVYYRVETGRLRQDKLQDLAAIATLKVGQIQGWRQERLHDARRIAASPGRDHRGVPVLADLRPVPGSSWRMVAKVDTDEILSEARYRAAAILLFVVLFILLAATGTAYAYRRQAQAALYALVVRREALLAAIPDILMETDRNKVYTWANQAGLEFFGAGVVGRAADSFSAGEQDTHTAVQPLFGGDENTVYVESWQRRQDGQRRLLGWRCRALKDTRGQVIGALSSARDITELGQREQELQERNEELNRFAFTVSHDLRSPLVTIGTSLGYLEQDLGDPDTGRLDQDLAYMRSATDRLSRLLDELLELSRVGRKTNLAGTRKTEGEPS